MSARERTESEHLWAKEEAEWEPESARRGLWSCVRRSARAKNVSVTAALCICLAWVTPVTQTFPSSLLVVLSHCWSSGSQSAHTHTHTIKHYLSVFPLSGPGSRLCVSLSRPGLSEPHDPGRAAQTVLLLFNYTSPSKAVRVNGAFPTHTVIYTWAWSDDLRGVCCSCAVGQMNGQRDEEAPNT